MTRIILAILIIGFSNLLYSQDHRLEIKQLIDSAGTLWFRDFDKTDQLVKKAEKLISLSGEQGYEADLLNLYNFRIQSCYATSRLQLWKSFITEQEKALHIYREKLDPNDYNYFRLTNGISLAQYYVEINDLNNAQELFTKLFEELKTLPGSKKICGQLFTINNYLAGINQRKGEYEAAINQHLASIHYYECNNPGGGGYNSTIYRTIGLLYLEKGAFQQAGKYLKLAEDLLQNLLKESVERAARFALSLYETQAAYYEKTGEHDSALFAMQKAIPFLKLQNVDNEFKGRINQSLGKLYLIENKFDAAKKYFDQSEGFFLKSQNNQVYYLPELYLNKAEFFEKQKNIEQALEYCRKAIDKVVLNRKLNADGNPDLQSVISKKQLFRVLQKKSRLEEKLYTATNDVNLLIRAFRTNQFSLALLDSTANEFSLDKDKIILSEQSYSAFEDGIRISNKLYQKSGEEKYFTSVVSLIERSKGNLLLENLRLVNRFSGIKQEWLEREKELKAEMLLTEQSLYQTENSDDVQKNRERYAAIKRDYGALIEQIKRDAPGYYKLRFDHSVVSPETIQKQVLKPEEALIEFFVGDSILAIAGFTNGKKYLNVKPMLSQFTEKLNQFRTLLTIGNSDFSQHSKEFYDFLLRDCFAELGPEVKSLVIIPDGLLGYLPFEVLVQSRDSKISFLNDKYAVHYAHSATYLMEQMQRKASDTKNFFAGFVSSGSGQPGSQVAARDQKLTALQGAEHEVASIAELFNSKFTIFNPANKTDFINHASDYKILHFAMHSSLNDENPMMSVMVFSNNDSSENLLTAIELYSMKLNSELAVLSACNTGIGELHRGEGIMSFSRAFAYAGVPSAIISLWKVPDIATSKIMVNFYKYLKKGETKDRSLQLAKLDFVKNNPAMTHPYYWSGFILTGNSAPLNFPGWNQWLWITIVSVVILLTLLVARKKIGGIFTKPLPSSAR